MISGSSPPTDGRHRSQEDQIGKGEVGQDAPRPEQSLEMGELDVVEAGALEGELGRSGHRSPPSPAGATGTGWGRRARNP